MDTHATARFPTTSWTHIRRSTDCREELGALLAVYWSPVYAYIRRRGHNREAAADLTQGFLTTVLLERNLLASADPASGRFRSYLLTALGRYIIDEYRRAHGHDGQRPGPIPADTALLEAAEPAECDDPVRAFERQWATTALNLANERVEADCRHRGLDAHWAMYEARYLRPACSNCEPVEIEQLAREHGVGVAKVYSMLNTIKRKIRNTLESVIMETLENPEDLSAEFSEIRRVLATPIV